MSVVPVLALDTSGDISVCVVADDDVLARRSVAERRHHAELLAPLIAEVLRDAGVAEPESVVVGTGPAPFTGLRAGLVTARTYAFTLDVPCHGICSLDALAAEALARGADEVVATLDARRKEVYAARYRDADGDVARLWGPAVDRPEVVLREVRGAVVVGEGLPGAAPPTGVDPAFLVRLARLRLARGESLPTTPLYLRRPDVTPSAGLKRVT